ncbi:MAG: flagellar motor protein MotB [Paracoccaceae bacterium]
MESGDNMRPIIIKKIKKGGGDGHHGGAWKVAYADFVTAMMAFFMLMWLLNATTEQQRSGIADYFTPTIAIAAISGGGDGAFGGDSVFTEETLARNGTGATLENPSEASQARGQDGEASDEDDSEGIEEAAKQLELELTGSGGESSLTENEIQHINTRITDEGLVIEFFELEHSLLFARGTSDPTQTLRNLARMVNEVAKTVKNSVAVEAHMASEPVVIAKSSAWSMSAERANAMRALLEDVGLPAPRFNRVTGHADRELSGQDPMAIQNNRIEVILLRRVAK